MDVHKTQMQNVRSRVKWHEEGEKNNAYFLGLMNSNYTRLDLHKVTDQKCTATDKKQSYLTCTQTGFVNLLTKSTIAVAYGCKRMILLLNLLTEQH